MSIILQTMRCVTVEIFSKNFLYRSIRVRTATPVSVRIRARVSASISFSFLHLTNETGSYFHYSWSLFIFCDVPQRLLFNRFYVNFMLRMSVYTAVIISIS